MTQVRTSGLVKKRILILTASFGEGHNSAARGIRDGLARVAPEGTEVELRDLFAETYPQLNELVRKSYLWLVDFAPHFWGSVYRWIDRKEDYDKNFRRFSRLKEHFAALLYRFQPDIIASSFPAYPYLLEQILGPHRLCKSVVVVTDSITVNKIWYRCAADYFLAPNEQSAAVLRAAGIAADKIKVFGFPVSPKFADSMQDRQFPSANSKCRVLYMIHAATRDAPELVQRLADLGVDLTVTIGRADKIWLAIVTASADPNIHVLSCTNTIPALLQASHLLIGKAGGATVQETIAAGCPMIINHVVSGQEEGNARLIVETNSGVVALSPVEVVAQVRCAFADGAKQWREWAANIERLSKPRAALEIAEVLSSI